MANSAASDDLTSVNKAQKQVACCRRCFSAPAAASAIAVAVAFALLLLFGATSPSRQPLSQLNSAAAFCDRLKGLHLQFCDGFARANGEDKFVWAQQWRLQAPASYACSGVEAECLHSDMLLHSASGTFCRRSTNRQPCGHSGGICRQGICTGTDMQGMIEGSVIPGAQNLFTTSSAVQSQKATSASGSKSSSSSGGSSSSGSRGGAGTGGSFDGLSSEQKVSYLTAEQESTEEISSSAPSSDQQLIIDSEQRQLTPRILSQSSQKALQRNNAGTPKLDVKKLHAVHDKLDDPVSGWPTATASVDLSKIWGRVPETFLATSHAYNRIGDYGDSRTAPAWAEIFKMLSPSPVLRIGGASQDKMMEIPSEETFKALKVFRDRTNARFIFGLPLWPKDAIKMNKELMRRAEKYLGGSVITYELGNEPEYWPTGIGGWASGKWQSGFDAYVSWFDKVALQLNPCGQKKRISGPGWGNVNTQPTSWWIKVMATGSKCYLQEMNVHYYPYINNATATAAQLLSQPLQDFGLSKFREYQRISSKGGLGIRISEANSLYGGGRADLCDTMVGTLWVVDALFAFSHAGAKALHLHWGLGGDPSGELGQPNVGVMTNFYYDVKPSNRAPPVPWPSVHAPWYGYLFWVLASAGSYGAAADTRFVPTRMEGLNQCGANMKVWALRADNGELRMALINKSEKKSCNVCVAVSDKKYCSKQATMSRLLPGSDGIFSKGGITMRGQTYERYEPNLNGKILGNVKTQAVSSTTFKDKRCGFCASVPAASAALLVVKA